MTLHNQIFEKNITESLDLHHSIKNLSNSVSLATKEIITCIFQGNKILICGNGGSAADSQHIAAELVGRFIKERKGLPALALTVDSSIITAWSNDYSYNSVFMRQIEALGKKGDILIAISTSGNSESILRAASYARKIGMKVISLTGKSGGKLRMHSNVCIRINSDNTARIQEMHMLCYHTICEIVEREFTK